MCTTIKDGYLFSDRHRTVLRLYQQLVVLTSPVDSHCRYRIHITAELGESLQFAILCLIDLQCTCHLLHALDLGTTSHTGYGNTHIDSRTETLVEQIGFKEYLTVCNGNDIGWNIRGNITCLCFDNRQCSQ